jgi:DNA polymerase I-like protein with 3'-5' exonuclease and polymerase domains
MVDIATITAAIGAATSAVGLFDKMADQIERFITKRPKPAVPKEHRLKIEKSGGDIVATSHGQEVQRITAQDLAQLPESQLKHIQVLEHSMENHYAVWAQVYPQLALMDSPVQKAKVEQQLRGIVGGMKGDLEGILSFLESCGIHLDDHYMHVRHLVGQQ